MQTIRPRSYQPSQLTRLSLILLLLVSSLSWQVITPPSTPVAAAATIAPASQVGTVLGAAASSQIQTKKQPTQLPAGLYPTLIEQQQAVGGEAYNVKQVQGKATWLATNPAQSFKLDFGASGVKINNWSIKLSSLEKEASIPPAIAQGAANRINYPHTHSLTEWYVNGPMGLEQGFTLAQPLAQTGKDGWLNLPVDFEGVRVQAIAQNTGWLNLIGQHGQTVAQYGKLYVFDATGKQLESQLKTGANGQQAILRVKLAGASYPVTIDPLVEQAQLNPSDGTSSENFGNSISLSSDGNTALIGAYFQQVGANTGQGEAYIFTRANASANWNQQAILTATDGVAGDYFGAIVDLSNDGHTALISAPALGANSNELGKVYVFTNSGATWTQSAKFTEPDQEAGDAFGGAIALSGDSNTALIGAFNKTVGGNNQQGQVYIFNRANSTAAWDQPVTLTDATGTTQEMFGIAVALSADGQKALVDASGKTFAGNNYTGEVFTFTRTGSGWSQQSTIVPGAATPAYSFGSLLALSDDGNTALIRSSKTTNFTFPEVSQVSMFAYSGASWNRQANFVSPESPTSYFFGSAIALSGDGNTALVGDLVQLVHNDSDNTPGAAYIFARSGSSWAYQPPHLLASDGEDEDKFGRAVALNGDGTKALITAGNKSVGANTQQGSVYNFDLAPIAVTSDPNPAEFGQAVTLTAFISPLEATGTVTFTEGATVLGTAPIVSGTAVYTVTGLSVGDHIIVGTYSGDSTYPGATSPTVIQIVTQAITDVSLTSEPNPARVGQTVTFTATVSPVAATGVVSFTEGSTVLGSAPLISGTAIYTTASLSLGNHRVSASYSGDGNYFEADSDVVLQVVCSPLVVTSSTDDGTGTTCGTLSYALSQPMTGTTPVSITFALGGDNSVIFSGSLTTTAALKAYMVIDGGVPGTTQPIVINGNGVSGDGLHLKGHNFLRNLTIYGFGNRQMVLEGTGNRFQTVKIIA